MSKLIKKITQIVMAEDKEDYYINHISLVVRYAKRLAKIENEDEETIELAALLHDIGRIRYGGDKHNLTGEKDAKQILNQCGYDPKKTKKICDAIISHGGKEEYPIKNKCGEIICSADGLAHLDVVPKLLVLYIKKKEGNTKEAIIKLIEKLDFEWNKKIILSSAKKIGEAKYNSAKAMLKNKLELKS